jgi:hypothetical protein
MQIDAKHLERFFSKFVINPVTGCWEWKAGLKAGYARFKLDGKDWLGHILSYEIFVGPVPEGKELHHRCENPPCVNWEHLEPLTSRDHILLASPNSLAYINMRKTICPKGHPLTDANIDQAQLRCTGKRRCRICDRESQARRTRARRGGREEYRPLKIYVFATEDAQVIGGSLI